MEDHEVIIIGAGVAGLVAAKTYLQVRPNIDIRVLDENGTLGGVWSEDRIYPELVNDSPRGYFEFSDLSMVDTEHPPGEDVGGDEIYRYLLRYAEKHDLISRIRFRVHVQNIKRGKSRWALQTSAGGMQCRKLIVATGRHSKPHVPDIASATFAGVQLHSVDLGRRHREITSDAVKSVLIVGGSKSAIEAIEICLKAGKTVHWLLRSGISPIIYKPEDREAYIKLAAGNPRPLFSLMPSPHTIGSTLTLLLLSGKFPRISNWLSTWLRKFFNIPAIELPLYDNEPRLAKIQSVLHEYGSTLKMTIFTRKSARFLDALSDKSKITVDRTEIQGLQESTAVLANGHEFDVDAIVWATGWELTQPRLFDNQLCHELGLPAALSSETEESRETWAELDATANMEILSRFRWLSDKPGFPASTTTPYRLHHYIVPTACIERDDRSIAFLMARGAIGTLTYAEVSALWTVAWLEGLHQPKLSSQQVKQQVAITNAFMQHRGHRAGDFKPVVGLESLCGCDVLLQDLGICAYRKTRPTTRPGGRLDVFEKGHFLDGGKIAVSSWRERVRRRITGWLWREWTEPYRPMDYSGIVDEYLELCSKRSGVARDVER